MTCVGSQRHREETNCRQREDSSGCLGSYFKVLTNSSFIGEARKCQNIKQDL
jgi:hypothetical protein